MRFDEVLDRFVLTDLDKIRSDLIQDLVFDSETKSALHTEMAKKNLFVKRGDPCLFLGFLHLFVVNLVAIRIFSNRH